MQQLLFVFLGGGLGSVCRYGIARLMPDSANFFHGTFVVNVLSCLVMGVVLGLALKNNLSPDTRLFFVTGFCGGFSTFSAFSAETLQLIESGNYAASLNYIFWSVLVCILCILLGLKLTSA
jgi:fluoride exporter